MTVQKKPTIISIIGGGLSATYILDTLDKEMIRQMLPLEVHIYEKGDKFAEGLAWSPDNNEPFHHINTYYRPRSIPHVIESASAFTDERTKGSIDAYGESSRDLISAYHKSFTEESKRNLQRKGVNCKEHPLSDIVDIQKKGDSYTLVDAKGHKHDSNFVIIATGHWQSQFESRKTWDAAIQPSPWPAARLKNFPIDEPVAVLGTGLSAVDACLTLAHNSGRFEKKDGELVYVPKNKNFRIDCYSRSGLLPSVLGFQPDNKNDESREVQELINRLPDAIEGRVTLDEAFEDVSHAVLRYIDFHRKKTPLMHDIQSVLSRRDIKAKEAVKAWEEMYQEKNSNPLLHLQKQLDDAKNSFKEEKPIWHQDMLRSRLCGYAEEIYGHLSAEDQDYFMAHIQPLYSKLAYGMVLENAEKMLALMKAGSLSLHATGDNYSIADNKGASPKKRVEIHYNDQNGKECTASYRRMVKATGDNPYKLRHSSPLMENMFKSGLASEMLTPYADQKEAAKAYEMQQKNPEKGNMRRFSGEYYRSGGTLEVNTQTYELMGDPDHPGTHEKLFALGPPISGLSPILLGINPIKEAARGIVGKIQSDLLIDYQKRPDHFMDKIRDKARQSHENALVTEVLSLVMAAVNFKPGITGEAADKVIGHIARLLKVDTKQVQAVYDSSKSADELLDKLGKLYNKDAKGKAAGG